MFVKDQNVTIKNSTISHCRNSTVRIIHSLVKFEGISTFSNNNAYLIQVMTINNSTVLFYGDTIFENNRGTVIGMNHSIIVLNGRTRILNNIENFTTIILIDISIIFNGSTVIYNHFTNNSGGAIHSIRGKLTFIGTTSFINNTATRGGGALYSFNTGVIFRGNTSFHNNSATQAGGGTIKVWEHIIYRNHNIYCQQSWKRWWCIECNKYMWYSNRHRNSYLLCNHLLLCNTGIIIVCGLLSLYKS